MNTTPAQTNKVLQATKAHWHNMKPRDKRLLVTASLLLGVAFCWLVLLSPAIKTIRSAPALHKSLDAQTQTMQGLSQEAKNMQAQSKLGTDEARQALQSTVTKQFGSAGQLNVSGSRATLTLKNANPQSVADFLSQARINARTLPTEVKLTRSAALGAAGPAVAAVIAWDGNMTLMLPTK